MLNLALFIVFLSVLVFVHELGHFLAAKAVGVKVLRFSIGFGSKIFGFKRGETEYWFSWIPFGGYVKMAGEQPYDEVSPEDAARGFLAQAPWKRALISLAGPAFNLVFPILIYFGMFVTPHEVTSTRVGSLVPGLPAAEAGLKPGDHLVAVDGVKVETFAEVKQALQPRYDKPVSLTVEREGKSFVIQLNAVRSMDANPVEVVAQGMIGISPYALPPVVGVPAGSPAEAAGLQTFDRILSINGVLTKDEVMFHQALEKASGTLELKVARFEPVRTPGLDGRAPRVLAVKLEKQPGEDYAALGAERSDFYIQQVLPGHPAEQAGIKAGDRIVAINGHPPRSMTLLETELVELADKPFTLEWRSGKELKKAELRQQAQDKFSSGTKVYGVEALGLVPRSFTAAEVGPAETVVQRLGVGSALMAGVTETVDNVRMQVILLSRLFTGRLSVKNVGGPLAMYDIAIQSAKAGVQGYLGSMAMISINLGLVNLLPIIPILDGFQLLLAFWEGIRRRPVSLRTREVAQMVGLVMLFMLMALAMRNDIVRKFFS